LLVAVCTFIALLANLWARDTGVSYTTGVINAFIIAVTIVVVAIPEGLPLAVNISLAYSTKKMYRDHCLIRVLAACETMGNATAICTDKTGTLTENRMTVVAAWTADSLLLTNKNPILPPASLQSILTENISVNRSAYLVLHDTQGQLLARPTVVGSKTEGALILLIRGWGFNYETVQANSFCTDTDRVFPFNSEKKRSTAVLLRATETATSVGASKAVKVGPRLYCKGASEYVLRDCSMYIDGDGLPQVISLTKRRELEQVLQSMADSALRTLCLAHRDFPSVRDLPTDWQITPPDEAELVLEAIVGIADPLRADVSEAIQTAQRAGIVVRMVTGDNQATACTIAKQCGILQPGGVAMEGDVLRRLTPSQLDALLPRLRVLARSSPQDKLLLVSRLNGVNLPRNQREWEEKHKCRHSSPTTHTTGDQYVTVDSTTSWDRDKDRLLPGYRAEWEVSRPDGGEVVGVTGDGTNDAPALKAADVGLSMGITGTKVAQSASDIVILDDNFSSIVKAISWGRAVYDNIRKFLQFQLTVNFVALLTVFVSAVSGKEEPLNAVQLLWVIMCLCIIYYIDTYA